MPKSHAGYDIHVRPAALVLETTAHAWYVERDGLMLAYGSGRDAAEAHERATRAADRIVELCGHDMPADECRRLTRALTWVGSGLIEIGLENVR